MLSLLDAALAVGVHVNKTEKSGSQSAFRVLSECARNDVDTGPVQALQSICCFTIQMSGQSYNQVAGIEELVEFFLGLLDDLRQLGGSIFFAELEKFDVHIYVIARGIYSQRQAFSVGDGTAMHQHVVLLSLGLCLLGKRWPLYDLQIIESADDCQGTQAKEGLPGA